MHGQIDWSELLTPDPEAAKTFYGNVFGWTFSPMPMPQGGLYWVAMAGETPVAGLMAVADGGAEAQPQWFTYIAAKDVDQSCEALTAAGGTILQAPWDIPFVGRVAIVMDAQKIVFGLMCRI